MIAEGPVVGIAAYITSSLVLESMRSFSPEEEDVAIVVQLRLIHAILMHKLSHPVGADDGYDDAKEEVNPSCAFHNNHHLQPELLKFMVMLQQNLHFATAPRCATACRGTASESALQEGLPASMVCTQHR